MATGEGLETVALAPAKSKRGGGLVEVMLRFVLFGSAVVAVVVMVTSKQTEEVPVSITPLLIVSRAAKFTHSPSFIYLVTAMSVAGLYAMVTTLVSFCALLNHRFSSHFIILILDVVMLGIVASATGAAGAVAYTGLKGNSHVGWRKVCNTYDTFCRHVGASVALSFLASILLTLLLFISIHSRILPKL